MMGIPLTVIIFFAVVVYFVCRAVQRSEQQEIRCVFDFYIAANEILRDEERRWYGFEIADVRTRSGRPANDERSAAARLLRPRRALPPHGRSRCRRRASLLRPRE